MPMTTNDNNNDNDNDNEVGGMSRVIIRPSDEVSRSRTDNQ